MATLSQGGVEQVRCALLQQHVSVQGRLPPPLHCQGEYDSPNSVPGKGSKGLNKRPKSAPGKIKIKDWTRQIKDR